MPGITANVSRNSFDFSKLYDKVTLQQGVPIPDSDWNELNDVLRLADILNAAYAVGSGTLPASQGAAPGYQVAQAGVTANNFSITAGWAMVGGVLVPTVLGYPPTAHDYEDDTNRIGEGEVTSFAAFVLTDSSKNWQAFHDLVSTVAHGPCRVKFLTGAEIGNTYDITAFTQTTLTLSGGAPAPGDDYIVKPPALTTPGGTPRTDEVYVQVWWEDINDVEDFNIQHPGLGVETTHREQRRWVVRVAEDNSAPVTPSALGFGPRYVRIAILTRPATTVDILTAQIENLLAFKGLQQFQDELEAEIIPADDYSFITGIDTIQDFLNALTDFVEIDPTAWLTRAVTLAGGGGLGNIADASFLATANVQTVLNAVDLIAARRRTRTTLAVDAAAGRKADYAGQDILDTLMFAGHHGPFLLNQEGSVAVALKEFTVNLAFPTTRAPDIQGEQHFGDFESFTVIKRKNAGAGNIQIQGSFKHIYFRSDLATGRLRFGGGGRGSFHLTECGIQAGHAVVDGSAYDMPWSIRNTVIGADGPGGGSTSTVGLEISEESAGSIGHGLIENCLIESPPVATGYALRITGSIGTQTPAPYGHLGLAYSARNKPLIIRGCTIQLRTTAGGNTVRIDNCHTPVIFENCIFYTPLGVANALGASIHCVSSNVSFYNCRVFSEESNAVRLETCYGNIDGLKIITGSGTANADPQALSVSSTGIYEYNVNDVEVQLGSSCFKSAIGGSPYPIVSIGAHDSTSSAVTNVVNVRKLLIRVTAATLGIQPILNVAGVNAAWTDLRLPRYEDIHVNFEEAEWDANPLASFGGDKGLIHIHDRSHGVFGLRISQFKLPNLDHALDRLLDISAMHVFDLRMAKTVNDSGSLLELVRLVGSGVGSLTRAFIETGSGEYVMACLDAEGSLHDVEVSGGQNAASGGPTVRYSFFSGSIVDGLICATTEPALRAFFANNIPGGIVRRLRASGVANMTTETARITGDEVQVDDVRVTCTSQSAGNTFVISGDDSLSSGVFVKGGRYLHAGLGAVQGDFKAV